MIKIFDYRFLKKPKVSVIISAYNNNGFLEKSLKSIVNQNFRNFEIIIANDGSTDSTSKIILALLKKSRKSFMFIDSKKNYGLPYMLNKCIFNSRGKYISRHDVDDISLINRLRIQSKFLDINKSIDVVGTGALYINQKKIKKKIFMPEQNLKIKKSFFYKNNLIHSSVLVRKNFFKKNFYKENLRRCQDYDLWLRNLKNKNFYNLKQILLIRNVGRKQYTLIDFYFVTIVRFKNIKNIKEFFLFPFLIIKDFFNLFIKQI